MARHGLMLAALMPACYLQCIEHRHLLTTATMAKHLEQPEYGYHFVLKEFCQVLQQLGTVKVVADPEREVDAIYGDAAQQGKVASFCRFRHRIRQAGPCLSDCPDIRLGVRRHTR
jgi:hypothetical protein